MKARKPQDLRNLSADDLAMALRDCKETMTNLRFQKTLGELESPAYISTLRKDIARINTILRERELSMKQ